MSTIEWWKNYLINFIHSAIELFNSRIIYSRDSVF